MTRPDLDAIRARCEAATPGPWKVQDHDGWYWSVVKTEEEDDGWMPEPVFDDGSAAGEYGVKCKPHDRDFLVAARTDIPALLAYIDELERRTTYTVGETEWSHRIAVAEQRFVDEYDAHQETRTLLTDLYMKQLRADAAQMREYGISYHGVRKVLAEYDGGELSLGKVVELFRAAAHELAKEEIAELKARIVVLESMKP